MSTKTEAVLMSGQVSVAVRKTRGGYTCTALQFDIVGTGKTEAAAIRQLQELVEEHLDAMLELAAEGKRIRFFNPSDAEEWNRADKIKLFSVSLVLDNEDGENVPETIPLEKLTRYRDRIESVGLVPA